MKKKETKELIDTVFLADLFDLTERRIQQLSTKPENVLTPIKDGKNNYYDLIPTVKSYIAHLKDLINGKSVKKEHLLKEGTRLDAEIKYKNAKAEKAELELKEVAGKLHRSEDVETITNELIFAIRGMLVAIPNRCSAELAEIDEPNEILKYLKTEVHKILDQLSNFKYDPEAYKKRVQRRNKKQEDSDYDEEE